MPGAPTRRIPDGIGLSGILAARAGHRQLAAELLGAWKAGGYERDGKAGLDLKGLLAANLDPTAAEQAALTPQASENLPEYGFCFRDGWGTPQETYLLWKCGKGGYRYHNSESSFVLYAHNRPLSLDGDENFVPARHAAISVGPEFGYVGRGVVERHFVSQAADYCRGVFAEKNVARTIIFAKNDYIVIRDDVGGTQTSHFHLPLLVHKVEQRGDHFYCPGRLGLDVLVYPLGRPPAKTQVTTDPLLRQQLITMTREAGDDHLNLISWTPPGTPPLRITQVGAGYRIAGADFVDHLFFTADPVHVTAGDIVFDGRAGMVRQRGGKTHLILFDGTRIALGNRSLDSPNGQPRDRLWD